MKHLFVPYEIALKLKEKGFDDPCFGFFTQGMLHFKLPESNTVLTNTPLYQQVIDWFRETEGFYIEVVRYDVGHFEYQIKSNMAIENSKCTFPTYYGALNKAIEEALNIIK